MVFQQLAGIIAIIFYDSENFQVVGNKLQLVLSFPINSKNVSLILQVPCFKCLISYDCNIGFSSGHAASVVVAALQVISFSFTFSR